MTLVCTLRDPLETPDHCVKTSFGILSLEETWAVLTTYCLERTFLFSLISFPLIKLTDGTEYSSTVTCHGYSNYIWSCKKEFVFNDWSIWNMKEAFSTAENLAEFLFFQTQCQDLNATSLLSVSFQTQTSQLSHRRNQHLFLNTRGTALNKLLPVVQKRSQVSVLKKSFHKLITMPLSRTMDIKGYEG